MKLALATTVIVVLGLAPGLAKYDGPPPQAPPRPQSAIARLHHAAPAHKLTLALVFQRLGNWRAAKPPQSAPHTS